MRKIIKRIVTGALCAALSVPVIPGQVSVVKPAKAAENYSPVMTVNMTDRLGKIMHGASGFLYGISSEDVPTMNLITPLKPKVLATKGALGTEHPYADALDVAETFLESGGQMVQMYDSNFYAIFGPKQYCQDYVKQFKEVIVPYVTKWKDKWKKKHHYDPATGLDDLGLNIDKVLVYLPINEGDSNRSKVEGDDFRQIFEAYYKAIKEVDPLATVGGMNPAEYSWTHVPPQWQWDGWHTWLSYLFDNDAMPDVITWHQLERNENRYKADIEEFAHMKNIFAGEGNEDEPYGRVNNEDVNKIPADMPPVVINEIAQSDECGVPGALVSWMGRLEDAGAYGCLPFWHQADNLNDLAADSNEANSAWWLYKWYADMDGQRLKITTDDKYSGIYGISTIDDNAKKVTTLFGLGSEDGDANVVLQDLDKTDMFKGAEKVHVKIDAAYFKGFNSASEPETILEGAYALEGGSLNIKLKNVLRSTGYRLTVTPAKDNETPGSLKAGPYHEIYEAEEAERVGNVGIVTSTKYFLSGPRAAEATDDKNNIGGSGVNNFADNRGIEYRIDIPEKGRYRLEFIYGNQVGMNRGNETEHKPENRIQRLTIDGEESDMILKNTMEKEWTAIYTRYVDFEKGSHTISIFGDSKNAEGNILQDALHVTAVGEYGADTSKYEKVFEAEDGDSAFNALNPGVNPVKIDNNVAGYTGEGYITGLNERSVKNGGGVRFSVVVEKSGLYNVSLRYSSGASGKATIYVGNAARAFDGLAKDIGISAANGTWMNTEANIYLQKGVNIVDIDASVGILLDNITVKDMPGGAGYSKEINAVDTIPAAADRENVPYEVWSVRWNESYVDIVYAGLLNGAEPVATTKQVDKIADTGITPTGENISYVVGRSLSGDKDAENDVDKYLEFEVEVPSAGKYAMQLFHSNDEIFGTHGYNTKIIDKFACIKVNDDDAKRYFFINTISRDTFKEKTVYLDLKAGINTIKIYNDDSWHVMKGLDNNQAKAAGLPDWREADPGEEVSGSYSSFYYDKPGNIPIVNSLPNFSKFVITPVFVGGTAVPVSDVNNATDNNTATDKKDAAPTTANPVNTAPAAKKPSKPSKVKLKKVTSPSRKAIKVSWKRAGRVTGYQIALAANKKMTKGKKVITVKGYKITAKTIKKLKSRKTYYVKVRAYNKKGKLKAYGKWSRVKKIKVR